MRNSFFWMSACALVAWLLCQVDPSVLAGVVVSTFEDDPALLNNLNSDASFEGLVGTPSQFRSGAVTFDNDGVYFGGTSWSGFGYSRRTAPGAGQDMYNNSNDLIAKPGAGANGSLAWGVVASGGVMTADAGYAFRSLRITNTLWTWDTIVNGDPLFAGPPMGNGGGTGRFTGQDDFFTVRFTNTDTAAFADFNLADFRPPAQPGGLTDYVHDSWQLFDVSGLAARRLSISFLGSRETNWIPPPDPPQYFLDTPAYAALDDITVASVTAVPEPGSLLLVGGIMALGLKRYRSSRRSPRSSQARRY